MWDEATLRARIADSESRTRFPGASPDEAEIATYEQAVAALPREGHALVLGMTPELRQMAGTRMGRLTSVDTSREAIDLYGDWVGPDISETVVCEDWLSFLRRHPSTFSAIFGDGIFGNVPSQAVCAELLTLIAQALRPGGRFVTRMALVPDGFRAEHWRFGGLLDRFRKDEIDGAEFGLTARLFGHYEAAYDESTSVLDNRKVYAEVDRAAANAEISAAELDVLRSYAFAGRNFVPDQRCWENMLDDAAMSFRIHTLRGKLWHSYYPVYECFRR